MARILTIGMAVHSDIRGVWMVIEHVREYYKELVDDVEFLVVDNDPHSEQGKQVREYIENKFKRGTDGWRGHYVSAAPRKSTSLRNLAFHCAETEYVMCVDSHILFKRDALRKLVAFLKSGAAGDDLYQGPAWSEQGFVYGTHMNPALRGGNFGTWGCMLGPEGQSAFREDLQPFEIPSQGMGLFVTRRDSWLQFPISYRHFSGEEGYIQEKYRREGRKAWCLPFLGWIHHYGHIGGKVNYPNTHIDKLRNHLIAFKELSLPLEIPLNYFSYDMLHVSNSGGGSVLKTGPALEATQAEVEKVLNAVRDLPMRVYPAVEKPFLGFPIRMNDKFARDSEDYKPYEKILPAPAAS